MCCVCMCVCVCVCVCACVVSQCNFIQGSDSNSASGSFDVGDVNDAKNGAGDVAASAMMPVDVQTCVFCGATSDKVRF